MISKYICMLVVCHYTTTHLIYDTRNPNFCFGIEKLHILICLLLLLLKILLYKILYYNLYKINNNKI